MILSIENKRERRRSLALLAATGLLLSALPGCGQTGALYLPGDDDTVEARNSEREQQRDSDRKKSSGTAATQGQAQ